jgi:hypothetical protein
MQSVPWTGSALQILWEESLIQHLGLRGKRPFFMPWQRSFSLQKQLSARSQKNEGERARLFSCFALKSHSC